MRVSSTDYRTGRELALQSLGLLLTGLMLWYALGLGRMDFRYPIAFSTPSDGTYYSAQTKILLETGWVFHHPDLSAPFGLDLYDFAHFDALHLVVMKVIGWIVPDWTTVLNAYYLLTYFLCTATALIFLRSLGIHAAIAIALALLFSFQPYHSWRGQMHIMLSGYYLLPLQMLATVWLLSPRGLGDGTGGSIWSSRRFQVAGIAAFVAVFAGHYYTFFAMICHCLAATLTAVRLRTWRPFRDVALLTAVVVAGFALNLLPNTLYWARSGSNRAVSAKDPVHVEIHSLRLTPMLMPVENHRVRLLSRWTASYHRRTPLEPNGQQSIGFVAATGFLGLLLAGLFAVRRDKLLTGLGVVTIGLVLFCTLSGYGTVFAYLVTPQMHGLSRVSILLALLGLAAIGIVTTPAVEKVRAPWLAWSLVGLAGGIGMLDLVPAEKTYEPARMAEQFRSARGFGDAIQKAVPAGTAIHQMPARSFPFSGYEQFVPFLYTKGMRWTCPAMLNRRGMAWCEETERLEPAAMVERLAICGVDGLVLYPDEDHEATAAMRAWLAGRNLVPIESGEGAAFYDLRPLTGPIRDGLTESDVRERRRAMTLPVTFRRGRKFTQVSDRTTEPRWACGASKATFDLVNHLAETARVRLVFELACPNPGQRFSITLPGRNGPVDMVPGPVSLEFDLPPGKTSIGVAAAMPSPAAGGSLRYELIDMECRLVGGPPEGQVETSAGSGVPSAVPTIASWQGTR